MASKILAGRYELIEKIGDGGMAVVYKAKDRLLNRFVAIKILKPEFVRDPKFIDSFRRESQAAAGLSHPNIVSVYDVGKEGNIYYIVMEVLQGDTLSDVIRQEGRLSEERAVEIAKQVALALSSAHKKNIIHRDVKPHNILMTEDGTVKIADFGIAKAVNSGTIVNNTSTVMGSVHYLSPEQARGGYVDARSDIYSLGIVLYEMLTGEVPFDGDNPVSVAMMHMNDDVPAPSSVNPQVSPALDKVVLKATAKHQPERYKNADEFYEALVQAEASIASEKSGYGLRDYYSVSRDERRGRNGDSFGMGIDDDYDEDDEEEDSGLFLKKLKKGHSKHDGGRTDDARDDRHADQFADTETKQKKKGSSGKKKVFPVLLALICAIPLSIFLINVFGNGNGDEKTVSIPDVIGMTEEQAADRLEKEGLEYRLGTPVLSDEDEGKVVSTDPEIGRDVKKGYTVTLILSRGKEEDKSFKLPNLVGHQLSDVQKTLSDYGLKLGDVQNDENSELPEGTVVSQKPDAGESVEAGDTVTLVVSAGKARKASVPKLVGLSQEEAASALKSADLAIGDVKTEYSDSVDEGLVISAEYEQGTEVEKGTKVSVVISAGPEPEVEQSVQIPLTIDFDDAENEVFNLTVTVTDDEGGPRYIVNNQQRQKSAGSEQVVLTGTGTDAVVRVLMDNQVVREIHANFETGELD